MKIARFPFQEIARNLRSVHARALWAFRGQSIHTFLTSMFVVNSWEI